MVRTAPTAKAPRMRVNNVARTRNLANGHTVFKSQTCLPVSSTANTATAVTSFDLTVGTSAVFPAAANLAKNFDKVKWKRVNLKWVPALPTSAGGSVAMYFDSDRKDVGSTTMTLAAQNKGATMGALWDTNSYNVPKAMLRPSEWFTTLTGSGDENTFASPGRAHVLFTAQPGITYTAATVIGYLVVSYEMEFGFPSASTDTTVPTSRRTEEQLADSSLVVYDDTTVQQYENFAAGCRVVPDFYQFLGLFDGEGRLREALANRLFDPDEEARSLRPVARIPKLVRRLVGVLPAVKAGPRSDFLSNWRARGSPPFGGATTMENDGFDV